MPPGGSPKKRERAQLAKSELLVHLAMTAGRWARELNGTEPGTLPVDKWPADDPRIALCRIYGLTPADLAKQADAIADEVERMAMRAGYERAWIDGDER